LVVKGCASPSVAKVAIHAGRSALPDVDASHRRFAVRKPSRRAVKTRVFLSFSERSMVKVGKVMVSSR
jgi:hypothetical protein